MRIPGFFYRLLFILIFFVNIYAADRSAASPMKEGICPTLEVDARSLSLAPFIEVNKTDLTLVSRDLNCHMHIGSFGASGLLAGPLETCRFFKTNNISEIIPFVDNETLLLLDLDETLILDPEHGFNRTIIVEPLTTVEGITTVETFNLVQEKTAQTLGFTARAYRGKEDPSHKTLENMGMKFTSSFPDAATDDPKSGLWNSIYYSHFRLKGGDLPKLLELLEKHTGYKPKKIMVLYDADHHCMYLCLGALMN